MDGNRPHRKTHPQNNKHDSDWKKHKHARMFQKLDLGAYQYQIIVALIIGALRLLRIAMHVIVRPLPRDGL